jgi:hypothetical protein
MKSFGICSIATNGYDQYLVDCIESFVQVENSSYLVNWYIFSDVSEDLKRKLTNFEKVVFHFFQIPSYGWPDATLLRYSIYGEYLDSLDSDFLMHLDADMLFLPSFRFPEIDSDCMYFVRHPGYASSSWQLNEPIQLLKRIKRYVVTGGDGSWETRKESRAYLNRRRRRTYFCGGIWFGRKKAFSSFVIESGEAVLDDLSRKIVAKWHDESHLNRFAAFNKVEVLGPQYCFDGKVSLGSDLPYVLAVEK